MAPTDLNSSDEDEEEGMKEELGASPQTPEAPAAGKVRLRRAGECRATSLVVGSLVGWWRCVYTAAAPAATMRGSGVRMGAVRQGRVQGG